MCAFNPDLNLARDDDDLRFNGSLFHSFGANTEKALSQKVLSLDLGTLSAN